MAANDWKKDIWDFQAKSGSSGSCRFFLHFLAKIAVQKMSGERLEVSDVLKLILPDIHGLLRQGAKKGGAKPHEENPPRKTVSDPPHLGTFCSPPPPIPFLLLSPFRNSPSFPQATLSETAFGGSPKMVSARPPSRGSVFRYVLPLFPV